MKDVPFLLLLAIAAMLFLAIAPLPYGYYTFMRIVTCGCAGYICYRLIDAGDKGAWLWLWAGVTILFNPLIAIHMTKEAWMVADGLAGLLFLFAAYQSYKAPSSPQESPPKYADTPLGHMAKRLDDKLIQQGYKIKPLNDAGQPGKMQATFVPRKKAKDTPPGL